MALSFKFAASAIKLVQVAEDAGCRMRVDGLDNATRQKLLAYIHDVPELPNETSKTHRFVGLLEALFPGSDKMLEYTSGIEKGIRIDTSKGKKTGRIDAFFGNAIIEFEKSLRATEATAKGQLREYASGTWAAERKPYRPLLCVASDGMTWKTYRPRFDLTAADKPRPDDITLEELRVIELSESRLHEFWLWLTSLLFRDSQTRPTAERFKVDFGASSPAFANLIEALGRAWKIASQEDEPKLAFDTWYKYLAVTYGQITSDRRELVPLFLKHTYLASLARLMAWASLSKGRAKRGFAETVSEVFSGEYFRSQKIENLVEDDFFQWIRRDEVSEILVPEWERILAQLITYDLSRVDEDVLKGVYQELVDPKDRHDLGEYYTPDWLCERIVQKLLPKKGFAKVLDPTCGSGSFLRASIAHMDAANPSATDVQKLKGILGNVVGIDIHPLAVTIARATVVLALGKLLHTAKRPVQIPVYLADALFLPSEVKEPTFDQPDTTYSIRFGGDRKVEVPTTLVQTPELFDPAITAAAKVALDHAKTRSETIDTLRGYLGQVVPHLLLRKDSAALISAVWEFTQELAYLIRKRRNSIWAFIVRNAYRPAMLREQFDVIVGNPPWLSYRYIADVDYQSEVKARAVRQYRIAPRKQKLLSQMELATVVMIHVGSTFLREGGRIGFVMPRGVLTADQHEKLRDRTYVAPLKVTSYWDLLKVRPLFNVPSCVLFGRKLDRYVPSGTDYTLPIRVAKGHLPARDIALAEAEHHLKFRKKTARVIFLGGRSALSELPGATQPSPPSRYARMFRNGATIYPRNFYFVTGIDGEILDDGLYTVETDPVRANLSKPPYRGIAIRGQAEGRFFYTTAVSEHVHPFWMSPPATVVLPLLQKRGQLILRNETDLRKDGYRDVANWVQNIEVRWKSKQSKSKRKKKITALSSLNYQGKLTAQNITDRHLVLYNASGTDLSACHVDRSNLNRPFVVDHKLYYVVCAHEDEAHYLVSILNSDAVNMIIKPFQSMGLMGQRDIHKKVLDLPIPRWSATQPQARLAQLGRLARDKAAEFASTTKLPASLARRRAALRTELKDVLAEIDATVMELLGINQHV